MVIKPILFNTEMIRAIMDGRKTCTRRLVRFLPGENPQWTGYIKCGAMLYNGRNEPCIRNAPYQLGDILYVRETWLDYAGRTMYRADCDKYRLESLKLAEFSWKPSIHMPKEAARIWLKVTDVRVERLQEITSQGAWKEGARCSCLHPVPDCAGNKTDFIKIWNNTIKKPDLDRYGWGANPWVWVIEFERCEKPEEKSPFAWNDEINKMFETEQEGERWEA